MEISTSDSMTRESAMVKDSRCIKTGPLIRVLGTVEFVMDKAKRLTVFPNSKVSRVSN